MGANRTGVLVRGDYDTGGRPCEDKGRSGASTCQRERPQKKLKLLIP